MFYRLQYDYIRNNSKYLYTGNINSAAGRGIICLLYFNKRNTKGNLWKINQLQGIGCKLSALILI